MPKTQAIKRSASHTPRSRPIRLRKNVIGSGDTSSDPGTLRRDIRNDISIKNIKTLEHPNGYRLWRKSMELLL